MNLSNIRLVATRDLSERVKTRVFQITSVLSILIVIGAVLLPKLISGSHAPTRLGVVGNFPADATTLGQAIGHSVVITKEPDAAAAQLAIKNHQIDVALIDTEVLTRTPPQITDTSDTARLAFALATAVGEGQAFSNAHLTTAQIASLLDAQPAKIQGELPPAPNHNRQRTIAVVGVILLFAFVSTYGSWVLIGVVEEKSSRVVEVLLSTLSTTELLTGKILGIGALALIQGVAVSIAALLTTLATGSNALRGAGATALVSMIGWFLLGYALYACMYGAAGSLIGRASDTPNVSFPITLPLLVAYITSISSVATGPTPLTRVLSFIPLTAPIAMPYRIAFGSVPAWQVIVSVALTVAAIVFVARLAAAVYTRSILAGGGTMRWRAAIRGLRTA